MRGQQIPEATAVTHRASSSGRCVGNVSETLYMRFKHILGPLCAASISVVLAGHALAQDNTVKIGALYPMSGNSASVGLHAKAAIETAVDIINNAHPELGDFPLARNSVFFGNRARRQPGQPGHRSESGAAVDHPG